MSLVIAGRIVPMSNDATVAANDAAVFKGKVWIGDDGRIAAVTQGASKGPPGFEKAAVVDVGTDLVVPGLIDLHSHLAYASLPLWVEPNRIVPFLHHNIWPTRPTYAADVTWPAYAFVVASPAELLAYAEVRALVGGTTCIQGSPPSNRPLDGWLARNVEDETLGGTIDRDRVRTSTLTLKPDQLGEKADQMRAGSTFIYHCAEGQPGSIVNREYKAARSAGCLQPRFVAIHCNAIDPAAFGNWTTPGATVWSPFSNLWLYGTTTDVPAAIANGLTVCIGSDWGPSGTRNALGELKVASLVASARNWSLTHIDLVRMVTANPGDVLSGSWGVPLGRLQPGALGDVTVFAAKAGADAFRTIVEATERDVRLVVVGGRAQCGMSTLMTAAGATGTSEITVAGEKRALALTRIEDRSTPWSFDSVLARMEAVRADPKGEINKARGALASWAGRLDQPEAPMRLALDMPTGIAPIGGLPKDLGQVKVPPLQPLAHDRAFFTSLTGRGFHGTLLDGLADFYRAAP